MEILIYGIIKQHGGVLVSTGMLKFKSPARVDSPMKGSTLNLIAKPNKLALAA